MEGSKEKRKISGGILRKTWERCKSFSHFGQTQRVLPPSSSPPHALLPSQVIVKSKSCSSIFPTTPTTPTRAGKWAGSKKPKVCNSTPKGCLSLYVGPEKQRFVIKVECTSHPLFKMLLDEAELEYGFHSNGPLVLPCDVDMFVKVLLEMDADHEDHMISHFGCSPRRRSSYQLLSPSSSRLVSMDQLL